MESTGFYFSHVIFEMIIKHQSEAIRTYKFMLEKSTTVVNSNSMFWHGSKSLRWGGKEIC